MTTVVGLGNALYTDHKENFETYWKRKNKWDPMGVIGGFINPWFGLSSGIEDLI